LTDIGLFRGRTRSFRSATPHQVSKIGVADEQEIMMIKVATLDDWQDVAPKSADWTPSPLAPI
jgi:hypothetical protein